MGNMASVGRYLKGKNYAIKRYQEITGGALNGRELLHVPDSS